jgi:hypothetical protein
MNSIRKGITHLFPRILHATRVTDAVHAIFTGDNYAGSAELRLVEIAASISTSGRGAQRNE